MVTRNAGNGSQTLTWTDTARPGTISNASGTSTSIYSADGALLLQKDPGTTTLYLGPQRLVLTAATGAVTGTRYIAVPGGAGVVRSGSGTSFSFTVDDPHGTPVLYLNSTAQTATWRQYAPTADRGARASRRRTTTDSWTSRRTPRPG